MDEYRRTRNQPCTKNNFVKMKTIKLLLTLVSMIYVIEAYPQSDLPRYKIVNRFSVPGEGGWDYLTIDESTGRLFLSHGTVVQVIDSKSGKLLGTITDTKGVHGIALANDLNKGFTSNGKDTSVTIFDLSTLATITKIKVTGINPDAILYDEFSHKIFVFNGKSSNATVIDAASNRVVETIVLDGKPEFAVSDGAGKVFVNIEDKSEIQVINSKILKVEKTWSVAPGEEPSGLALDRITHRLFSVCNNKMMVIMDSENGKVITSLPIGGSVDGVAFDPELKTAYSSNGDGTVTVVLEKSNDWFKVIETIATQKGARTIALDKKTHHVYLTTAEYGDVPDPTAENPKRRPPIKPETFKVIDIGLIK